MTGQVLEAVTLAEAVLGPEWKNDSGKWVNYSRKDADKVLRVMAEVQLAIREKTINGTPARMAHFLWTTFR